MRFQHRLALRAARVRYSLIVFFGIANLSFTTPSHGRLCLEQTTQATDQNSAPNATQARVTVLTQFEHLSPDERVRIWKDAKLGRNRHGLAYQSIERLDALLASEGTDTVQQLSVIIRDHSEPMFLRFWAISILARMQCYVPVERQELLPTQEDSVPELNQYGTCNPFAGLDDRRIGNEGYETLLWAANQTDDHELRFDAELETGILKTRVTSLPIDQQVPRWVSTITKAGKLFSAAPTDERAATHRYLTQALAEEGEESLPFLLKTLNETSDPWTREAVIFELVEIDYATVRLRAIPLGREAIESIHHALIAGHLRPNLTSAQKRNEFWDQLRRQFYEDDLRLVTNSKWVLYAHAMNVKFGDKTWQPAPESTPAWRLDPKFKAFLTFLTKQDPHFPSWEFAWANDPRDELLNPRFDRKVQRYHDEWVLFLSESSD